MAETHLIKTAYEMTHLVKTAYDVWCGESVEDERDLVITLDETTCSVCQYRFSSPEPPEQEAGR